MSRKTRKLMWSVPLIAAVAVIGALAAFMTLQPNGVAAQTLETPGQVQNFKAAATEPDTIKLTWDAPSEGGRASGYRIDVSADGLTWELLNESVPGQDDEYDHTGLMARQTKYYRIFAHNTGGTKIGPVALSSPMSVVTNASTKPMNPTDLEAAAGDGATTPAMTQTQITLTWTPPDTPTGTKIHEYKVAYAQNPQNLRLGQSRTLKVSSVPVSGDDAKTMVYCGVNGDECMHTFTGLLEHETWHFQVYAVNMDAMGVVGTSNPSDTKSATTADGLLPAQPTTVWAAVNKNSPAVWLYWTPPADPDDDKMPGPAGAPVTNYLIQGRPETAPATPWVNSSRNVRVFHNRPTSDLLLTAAELRPAALAAWQADDRLETPTLDDVPNFESYFNNLQWEFRIFALNSVWTREVQANSVKYTATLADTGTAGGADDVLTDDSAVNDNRSATLVVSLNELNEEAPTADPPGVGDIAPVGVNLQKRIGSVKAVKHSDTNGGRTRIDLSWKRTYSHDPTPETDDDTKVYATEYRIQYSTDPDASDWMLLDQDGTDPHNDFTAAQANCDTDDTCTVSHMMRTAGTEYTYRVFAMNAATSPANLANTVFSWWQVGSETTSQAEKPGRPTGLMADQSISNGHTEIDLSWTAPEDDADGEGDGLGYGSLVKYVIQKSDDGGETWSELVRDKKDFKKTTYTHKGLMPGQTVRYRVATVNKGPREKMSDWSDSATQTTEKSTKPDKPEGLVAEAVSPTSIKLCWNIQSRTPPAAPIKAYVIEYEKDGEWMQLARITDADADDNGNMVVRTMYTDNSLNPKETRKYRVRAENVPEMGMYAKSEESEHAEATTMDAVVPDAPTGLSATAASDMQIDLMWTAPADPAGAPVTGFIIERAYGDVMFLDHEDAMGDAFTDAQTWWDGLGCEAMVAAVMDDGEANSDNPFCKMYAGLDEASKMTVDEYFMKRYAVVGDVTSYEDTGLMEMTEYTYRVKAVNAKGAGEWSDTDMATTMAADTSLGAPSSVTATADGNSVTIMWGAARNADRYIAVLLDENFEFDIDHVATHQTDGSVTFDNVPAGTYTAGVISIMDDDMGNAVDIDFGIDSVTVN